MSGFGGGWEQATYENEVLFQVERHGERGEDKHKGFLAGPISARVSGGGGGSRLDAGATRKVW